MEYKPLPRPTGESAEVVITEYDLPSGDVPNYHMHSDGTFWTDGVPSTWDAGGVHDASMCKDGFVYFTDTGATDNRTIGKLDPRTGRVTSYKLKQMKNDLAANSHGIICDPDGGVWFTNQTESTNTKFDPKTEQFRRYPKPDSIAEGTGGSLEMDSEGNLWTDTDGGFAKLDPRTGGYTAYDSLTPGGGKYGTAIDREDNIYITQMPFDIIGKLNSRTGKVSEIRLNPWMELSDKDQHLNQQQLSLMATPWMGTNGPRRSATFRTGDYVYFPLYWGNSLAKVNIHTNEVRKFQVPVPHALPYNVMPDRNGMIWISLMNAERIAKFDPTTEKFTIYKLPSLGYETRYIEVDNSTDPPSVWVPSGRNNKIARVQFRTLAAANAAAK
jgi:streptogramin lyase